MKWVLKSSVFLVLGCCLAMQPVRSQVWTGDAGDSMWDTAGNWSGNTVPGAGDIAFFSGGASVTLPATTTTVGAIWAYGGAADPTVLTGTLTTNFDAIYYILADNGTDLTLSIPSGASFSTGATYIGYPYFEGGSGTLTINGTGTVTFDTSFATINYIGVGAQGTLNQSAGTLVINGAMYVGGDGGTGDIGNTASGSGAFNLSGTSTVTAEVLDFGVGSSATAGTSSGTFTMTGGSVTATTINLGVSSVSPTTGVVNGDTGIILQSAGKIATSALNIGESSGGAGSYTLDGTGVFSTTTLNIGDNAGSSGTFTQFAGSGTFTTFDVGNSGKGTYTMQGGSLTGLTTGAFIVGNAAGSTGVVTQSAGTITLQGSSELVVGDAGTGSYSLGGVLTVNNVVDVGTSSGTGTFTLTGAGVLNATGGVNIGGNTGTGVFNFDGGSFGTPTTVVVSTNGTFNQNISQSSTFTPSPADPVTLTGGNYNLNSGTLAIGGDMGLSGSSGVYANSGNFNFGGGTLLVTGGALTDPATGTVTGNSTINTAGGNATLSASLAGNGILTLTGGGLLTLSGDSSAASWGVDIMNGTGTVTADDFPSSGNITVESTGTFQISTSGGGTITPLSGAIGGAGMFDVFFGAAGDTLQLSGPLDLTGTTTLAGGGTLEVGNGTLGAIGGTGALTVGGSTTGTVNILGMATYNGLTTVDPGYRLNAASIAGNVTNSGGLGSSAALTDTKGASTLNIGGNLVSTGTLVIRMNGLNADDFVLTTNHATANISGATEVINAGGTGTFNIVSTQNAGDVTFTGSQPTSTTFIHLHEQTDATDQYLQLVSSVTPINTLPGLVLTSNEASVAAPLDALLLNPSGLNGPQASAFFQLLNALGPLGATPQQIASGLESLTPESLQYAPTIAFENATFLVQDINAIEGNIHHNFQGFDTSGVSISLPGFNSDLGHEMQTMLASFHDTAPNGVNYYPESDSSLSDEANSPPPSPEPSHQVISDSEEPISMRTAAEQVHLRDPSNHFTEFIGGDVTLADLNQSQGAVNAPSSKASYTAGDAIAGVGYHITSNLTAGILMDYNHTDAKTDDYGSKMHLDSYAPGLWATYGEKGFFANALFSYGINSYSNSRAIPVINQTATSSPNGNQYVGDLDFGYEFHPWYNWTLAPTLGLTYTHLDVDSFTESGAYPADLSVNAQHDDSFRSRLGGYVTYLTHPGQVTLQPTFTAMWQHEYLDQSTQLTSQFNDFPAGAFTINSVTTGRDSALVGGGLTATFDNSMALFINATADIGSNYDAENIVGGFKGTF